MFEYAFQNQIISLYEENNKLTSFVYENYSYWEHSDPNKEELVSLLRIKEIVNEINNKIEYKEKLEKFVETYKKISYHLYNEHWQKPKNDEKKFFTGIYEYLENESIKEKELGVIKILEHITFYKFNDVVELRDNVFALMRQRIIQKQCDQVLRELVSENFLNSKNTNDKKSKNKNKNKKKKKKVKNIDEEISNKENKSDKECEEKKVNEENANDIKNDEKAEDEKNNKINMLNENENKDINEKLIVKNEDSNQINNNGVINNGNDKNIINNNENTIKQEEIKSSTLITHETNKNNHISSTAKSKNKTKEFFLYPIINSNSKGNKKKKNICSLSESKQKELTKIGNEKIEDKKEKITQKESIINKSSPQSNNNSHKNQELTIQNEHLDFYKTEQKTKSSPSTYIKNDNNNINYMIVPFFQFLNTNYTPSEKYFESLSKEISNYIKITNENISKINPIRLKHLIEVENLIKTGLCEKYEIKFGHYGSYFTGLSIEGSDIDILIFFKSKIPSNDINNFYNDIILLLNKYGNKFEEITPILTASVPIIKLQVDITNETNDLNLKNLFYLDKENELNKIKIDLSFTQNEQDYTHSYEIVSYITQSLNNFNLIKSLLLVLKRYFKVMKMNKSYTGGLSSYSLYLLIYTFIKNIPNYSLGKSFYFFLTKFSYFDFKNYGIDIEKNIFVLNSNESDKKSEIIIIDPLTKLNVAKSSFNVDDIQKTFRNAFELIRNEGWLFDCAILSNKTGYDYLKNFNKSYGHNFEHDDCNDYITIKKLFGLKNTNIF